MFCALSTVIVAQTVAIIIQQMSTTYLRIQYESPVDTNYSRTIFGRS